MSKAEDKALNAYPIKIAEREGYDENLRERKGFVKGYRQAERDLELSLEDMVLFRTLFDAIDVNIRLDSIKIQPMTKEYYQEVLERFKDLKK